MVKIDFKAGYSVSGKGLHYTIHQDSFQQTILNFMRRNQKRIALVNLEIKKMFRKGAIKRTQPVQGEFLSNLFLVGKKGEGNRSVINLKILNQFVPFFHFKMERLSQFKALNTGLDVQTGIEG